MIIIRDAAGERFTSAELYPFFARLWSRWQVVSGHRGDASHRFQSEDLRVNVMGIRGLFYGFSQSRPTYLNSLTMDKSGVFDDCILVLRRENGAPRVYPFAATLHYGRPNPKETKTIKGKKVKVAIPAGELDEREARLRDLRLGMHRYQFGFHHQGKTPYANLTKTILYPKTGYRALRPLGNAGAFYDEDMDRRQQPQERLTSTNQHNIHAGADSDRKDGFTYGEGCQVLKSWGQFKRFMGIIEADYSLRGTESNELEPKRPASQQASRDITYALLGANSLFPCLLPVGEPQKRAISLTEDLTALGNVLDLVQSVAKGLNGGNFPIGENHCWHGGLHLPTLLSQDVFAPMAGEIVAFRLGNRGFGRACASWKQDGEELSADLGNHNFILMRHRLEDTLGRLLHGEALCDTQGHALGGREHTFYSLYMHLAEHDQLERKAFADAMVPFRWLYEGYVVKVSDNPKRPTSFPAYETLQDGDGVARSHRGMVDTEEEATTLVAGDRFRVLQDNLLVQENELWVQIERYYDGSNKRPIDPPERLYTQKKHIGGIYSAILPEWKQQDFLKALTRGDIILAEEAFGHPVPVSAGELLWRAGEGLQPGGNTGAFLHWSIFSTEPIFPRWKLVEDQTQDSVIEDRKILELVPQAPERKGKPLSPREVRDFYRSEEPEIMKRVWELAWTAFKYQSEWAGDPAKHASHLASMPLDEERQLNQQAYQESANPFLWWREVAKKVGLPEDGKVWHYHPAMFTLALGIFTGSAHLASLPGTPVLSPALLPDLKTLLPTSPAAG